MTSSPRQAGLLLAAIAMQSTLIVPDVQAQSQTLQNRLDWARLRTLSALSSPRKSTSQRLVSQKTERQSVAQTAPQLQTIADEPRIVEPRIVEPRRNRRGATSGMVPAPGPALGTGTGGAPAAGPAAQSAGNVAEGNPPTQTSENPSAATDASAANTSVTADVELTPSGRRPISFYVDTRLGFDKQNVIVDGPQPIAVAVKRVIRTASFTVAYPLGSRTDVSLSVPVISQTARSSALGRTLKRSGTGVGDLSVFLQQRFPQVAHGTDAGVSLGLVMPTGRDVFEIGPTQLPTGNGFYQALLRLSVQKLRVPLQLYASVDYGKALSRTVNGQKFQLPDQYGFEAGFYYAMGPEWTSQTGVSYNKVTSPFILNPDSAVAYLSQSLTYNSGQATTVRGSIDVGLTDDSTDVYAGLSLNRQF